MWTAIVIFQYSRQPFAAKQIEKQGRLGLFFKKNSASVIDLIEDRTPLTTRYGSEVAGALTSYK